MTTLEQLIDDFSFFGDDWESRYQHLIELGHQLPAFPDSAKTEANKVHGCMSQVWFIASQDAQGRYIFQADSDAVIVKGLVAVLLLAYSGKTAADIGRTDIQQIFTQLDLGQHLSPNRRNGFFSMVEKIKALAGSAHQP